MSEVAPQTLHIVARELNVELNDARVALENFGEQQDDVRFLENCRDRLHLVYGALRVSEVYGAALLAEEMEQVARYLIGNFNEKRHLAEGLDALMRAMVQLPTYLERVLGGGRDMALILLPLLNDLRAVRGHALLSEGTLLLLNLTSDKQANPLPPAPGEHVLPVANWARKLRARFQLGLLGWIKGEREEQNLEALSRVAEKLEQVATTQSVFQLWWVIGAVVESLRDVGLDGSASVKRLLGQADRELRRLYEQGEQQYAERPPVELLNNLLYYVARSHSEGPRVSAVRASFRLNELLPVDDQVEAARESLAAPSIKLMKTVASAIKEDLAHVKDALDIFVRKPGSPAGELAPQLEMLRKIGDTLGVLGLVEPREKVQHETAELRKVVESNAPLNEALLMRVAGTLINVEDGLDEQLVGMIAPTGQADADSVAPTAQTESGEAAQTKGARDAIEFRQVTEAVLRECIVNMARIKEAIALSVERPKEAQILEQVPPLIRGITAGLLMLGKTRAVELTEAIGKALVRFVHADGVPVSQEAMDRLADAIVAIEYYMETLQAGRSDPWYMLDNAEACLQALSELSTGATTSLHSLRDLQDHAATLAVEPTVSASTMVIDRADRTALLTPDVAGSPQATQVIPKQQAAKQAAAQAATRAANSSQAARASASLPPVLSPPADKADPEFVELFIEEAREEIAKLDRFFPLWDENPQDQQALVEIRRSFHTLKGSGRMVGAQLIGECAWAIENMLNRVINKTLDRSPDMMVLMRRAVAAVPELVEQLESGRAPDTDIYGLIAEANSISMLREAPKPARSAEPDDNVTGERTVAMPSARPAPARAPSHEPTPQPPARAPAPQPRVAKATVSPVIAPTPPPKSGGTQASGDMDAALQEIFSKETVGHLAAIREYVGSCALLTPPFPVTEALHRACHTLSGTAKTAGARQGIKIAEPLNHYVRKLYDNGVGLPAAGMQVLRDSVRAIENVVEHINESTGYFITHTSIIERIVKLEQALDAELSMMAQAVDATAAMPVPELRPVDHSDDDEIIELSFDANADDHELGLESPTRQLRTLGHSGETVEVALDPTVMEEAIRTGPLGRLQAEPDRHATVERTQRIDPPALQQRDARQSPGQNKRASSVPRNASPQLLDSNDATMRGLKLHDEIELDGAELASHADVQHSDSVPELVVETEAWAADYEPPSLSNESESEAQAANDAVIDVPHAEPVVTAKPTPAPTSPAPPIASAPIAPPAPAVEEPADVDDEFDADVAAIFTEEATELLEVAESSLSSWSRDRANQALAFELKRALHTLKGGARMAGIRAMGDLSHELESLMQGVESGQIIAEQSVLDLLQASLDELHRMRDVVSKGMRVPAARELLTRIRVAQGHEPPAAPIAAPAAPIATAAPVAPVEEPIARHDEDDASAELKVEFPHEELTQVAAEPTREATSEVGLPDIDATSDSAPHEQAPAEIAPDIEADSPAEAVAVSALAGAETPVEAAGASDDGMQPHYALPPGREAVQQERGEVARVDADLLDTLLNNAGEVSILRSRMEQQANSIEFNLAELGRTVTRLKEQLRKLELETEAQILHRHQEENATRADFDPLELDRYSALQQLSRALAESVSDVASIESLLENQTREAQNLLLQQSRVVTEVQNGLMKTRMVPFSRHVQRLSRIVRQVAGETGKRAELAVSGASGELDRQVLERMLPPLEHMLRNSVVHGIETPEVRKAAGKPESGTIRIGLEREGSEISMVIEDDGRGIDVNAVRERAKARGLLKPGRTLTDEEALQLVLEPGFSTAQQVTQHAGRGVGMDVVVAEIKKLGGALFTRSTPGQGVRFTVRLPFTLAMSQALIVRVGEEMYALPLSTVEGVARVPRAEVANLLSTSDSVFNYGSQSYHVQHLGAFIDAPASALPDADVPVPLILVNAGEHSTALVVDELVGNREIVVKPVGPQISGIRGVSGATILGDGRIVVILDMGALVRSGWRARTGVAAPLEDRRVFALVVDDSITVRRVTQRLLERNGMRVATAKDGVDALAVLQEHTPDIILLDIEMPRMDGYEFAAQVRNDPRVADIPIVMITSRVGEKHRARAIELGVNDYLGKPYQENQLLDAIEPLVEARRRRQVAAAAQV